MTLIVFFVYINKEEMGLRRVNLGFSIDQIKGLLLFPLSLMASKEED